MNQKELSQQKNKNIDVFEQMYLDLFTTSIVLLFYYQLQIAVISMNIQVTCPKCELKFTQENPPKNLINCQHVICFSCLNSEILCPIDRKRLERRRYKIENFQTNKEILDFIVGQPQEEKSAECQNQEQPIYSNDVVSDAKESEQSNHQPMEEIKIQEKCLHHNCQIECIQPTSPKVEEYRAPKFQDINFETCLLHSKSADLICLKDKCLICSNCGLFGEHKNHDLLPYDTFIVNYTALIEHSYNNFELLKKSEEQITKEALAQEINTIIKEKRDAEIKYVRRNIAAFIVSIKNTQKTLIAQIDGYLKEKKDRLLKELNTNALQNKVTDYYKEIEKISQGSIDIFKLQNIERYIDYADENNSKSYINKQGEYLIAQVDSYAKQLRKKMTDQINEFEYKCSDQINEVIANCFEFVNKHKEKIEPIQVKIQAKRDYSKANSPVAVKKRRDEDLLINSKSNEAKNAGNNKHVRDMSPIQPIPKFQQTFDTTFKNSYKQNIITQGKEEYFLKVKQVQPQLYVPQHKKTMNNTSKSFNQSSIRQNQNKKEPELLNPLKNQAKPSSNNSSHIVQRQILSVLNENKKKKKLDLPQKFIKHYDQLQKDRLDVLDFGGAFLGDQTALSISELFQSRNKLKSVKMMNNKLSDEVFPELIFRSRNLLSINLSYNNLTEKSLEWLEKQAEYLGSLSTITLSNNKIVLRNVKDRIQNLRKKGIKVSL